MNDLFSSDNLDIIYYDLSKKWKFYNRKKSETTTIGLCYQGFAEFFLTYSQLNFNEKSLELSLKSMISHCKQSLRPPENLLNTNAINLNNTLVINDEKRAAAEANESSINTDRISSPPSSNFISSSFNLKKVSSSASSINAEFRCESKRKTKKSLFPIFF